MRSDTYLHDKIKYCYFRHHTCPRSTTLVQAKKTVTYPVEKRPIGGFGGLLNSIPRESDYNSSSTWEYCVGGRGHTLLSLLGQTCYRCRIQVGRFGVPAYPASYCIWLGIARYEQYFSFPDSRMSNGCGQDQGCSDKRQQGHIVHLKFKWWSASILRRYPLISIVWGTSGPFSNATGYVAFHVGKAHLYEILLRNHPNQRRRRITY
jgi:hypothetical protein